MVYYYSIGEKEVCLAVEAAKTSNVALLKPAPVRVYDYYDNSKFLMRNDDQIYLNFYLNF
jgi:A-macroglobulin receptor binding domain